MRYLIVLLVVPLLWLSVSAAESSLPTQSFIPPEYIFYNGSPISYIQNPYAGQVSGGGTRVVIESSALNQNAWQHLFDDGIYNVAGSGIISSFDGIYNYSMGAYFYGQTGAVAGFSLGAQLAVQTPQTPGNSGVYLGTTGSQQKAVELSQAYLEYSYNQVIQADIGRIALNTPWVNSSNPSTSSYLTYQGLVASLTLGSNLTITGFGINQLASTSGFNSYTMYNSEFSTPIQTTGTTPGAIGLGMRYSPTLSDTINLWGYHLYNYANLAYVDNKYTLNLTPGLNLTFAAQAAAEGGQGDNVLNNPQYTQTPYGSVNSNILGAQFGISYGIWSLLLSYDGVFGSGSFGDGGFVSPYTYQMLADPLYTTSQIEGMITTASSGNSYKIAAPVSLLNQNITITPQFAYLATNAVPSSQEFDLIAEYTIPQVKGLMLEGAYSYMQEPDNLQGVDSYFSVYMLFIQYLY